MKFTNLAKGQITQTIAKMLFERAGYRVTRFGIEELFYEVVHLDQKRYLDLGLPLNLRSLPDFLVADPAISMVNLVEVKFRKRFSEESAINLYETLRHQFEHWPNAVCMLMVSEAPNGGKAEFNQQVQQVRPRPQPGF